MATVERKLFCHFYCISCGGMRFDGNFTITVDASKDRITPKQSEINVLRQYIVEYLFKEYRELAETSRVTIVQPFFLAQEDEE